MVVPSAPCRLPRCWYRLQRTLYRATPLSAAIHFFHLQYNKGEWLLPAWSILLFTFISACIAVCLGFSTYFLTIHGAVTDHGM